MIAEKERLRHEYNAAVANGLMIRARHIERQIQALSHTEEADCDS